MKGILRIHRKCVLYLSNSWKARYFLGLIASKYQWIASVHAIYMYCIALISMSTKSTSCTRKKEGSQTLFVTDGKRLMRYDNEIFLYILRNVKVICNHLHHFYHCSGCGNWNYSNDLGCLQVALPLKSRLHCSQYLKNFPS